MDIVTPEALELLAERLITPLQIQHYLTRVLEQAYRFGEKPVTPAIVERPSRRICRHWSPPWHAMAITSKPCRSYSTSVKRKCAPWLHGQLPPGRTEELHHHLLATGIPLGDHVPSTNLEWATG